MKTNMEKQRKRGLKREKNENSVESGRKAISVPVHTILVPTVDWKRILIEK